MKSWIDPQTGCQIAYDDEGQGVPVVMLHAFPLCREMWAPQRASLSQSYRFLTPDLFGFGASELPAAGWTVDSMADALAGWLTAIGIEGPVVIGGLSMGGYVALAFARRHPKLVKALILADTRADADSEETRGNREKTKEFVRENSASALIERMLPGMVCDMTRNGRPEILAEVRRLASAQSVPGILAALTALRDRPDSTPSLKAFPFPVLILVGLEDSLTPPKVASLMAEQLSDVTEQVIPSAGHLSNLEMPEEFNAAILHWLEAVA